VKARVLYVVSRFPKVTETFVVNEWSVLADRFEMYLAALTRTGEPVRHDATRAALARAWFPRRLAASTFVAHGWWVRRAPRRYGATLATVLRSAWRTRPTVTLKTLAAFHQGVALARRANETGIEHVHAHFANHAATAGWVVHRLTDVPYSFTAHANDVFRTPPLLARKADDAAFVVAISEYNRGLLLAGCPGAPVHVVHCGADLRRFSFVPRADAAGAERVLCVAGFEPKKGHRDLLTAFASVARQRPGARLVLVGDGPERQAIEGQVTRLGVADRVELLGARGADDVVHELSKAAVFALPSVRDTTGRMDGIPVAIMEAMAAGVPVVTTSVSGIPELVDETCGIVVAPGDTASLARAITTLLDDTRHARTLATNARARVETSFDLAHEAGRVGDLIAASISSAPRGVPATA
jgi:glycosyltransferase involved in cell wall biosynthesis